jgi:hypothetical protein
LCTFWNALKRTRRDGTDRYNPRPGSQPFRPDSKVKPFKRSRDMLNGDSLKKFREDNET